MRFFDIMRDRRGFVHKKIFGGITGAIGGFLSGGPLGAFTGGIGGFLGGGRKAPPVAPAPVPSVVPGHFPQFTPSFAPPPSARPITGTRLFGGGGSPPLSRAGAQDGCPPLMSRNIDGKCVVDIIQGGRGLFGSQIAEPLAEGLVEPEQVCIDTLLCPTFADGKKGVLWMNAMTGQVVCLPRGVNGSGFGLIRKNRPRRKAFVTAAEISALRGQARTKKKAKKFASLTGQTCVTRGSGARSSRH